MRKFWLTTIDIVAAAVVLTLSYRTDIHAATVAAALNDGNNENNCHQRLHTQNENK
jgi:hypothetical protein